jgi:hypothetical protein
MRRGECSAGELLELVAVGDDGLAIRRDGAFLRYLEVSPVNPLVAEEQTNEHVAEAFGNVAARLEGGQGLQLYVQAEPLGVDGLLAKESHAVALAAGAAHEEGKPELARALRRLGLVVEHSLLTHSQSVAAVALRYLVVVPWQAQGTRAGRRGPLRLSAAVHERAVRDSLRHTDGIARDLEAMRLTVKPLVGREILDLLWGRFDPDAAATGYATAGFMRPDALGLPTPGESEQRAAKRSRALREAVCTAELDFSARAYLRIGVCLEQVSYLAGVPEYTWLGWLLHFMQAPRPFVLAVHIHATDRFKERQTQKRRWKRLRGVRLGAESRGQLVDPEVQEQEREAEELGHDLATSAGAGVYRMSLYFALRELGPEPDLDALHEYARASAREVTLVSDGQTQPGWFAQRRLWQSSLPLALDTAGRTRRYLTRNIGDSFPLVGTSCSSPSGIPLGYAQPGRTLERLDPFDTEHENHMLIVNGRSGTGKTMTVHILLIRALCKGLRAAIIDRAGHFEFLAGLIPGAVHVTLGARGNHEAVCPWDVPDPGNVEQSKVDFLLALHALLLGREHTQDGLGDLEENLLSLAIREVYARCASTGEQPRELLLQEELWRREVSEANAGATDVAATLRNLALRLSNYTANGPYAYLTDWPTTVTPGSPLVIFDTRSIPDSRAAAALFIVSAHVTERIEHDRTAYLAGQGPRHEWAGRNALVIDEAWKLIEKPATGRWVNELTRRSRHLALWLIGMSQQLSDFDHEHGRALLKNASMKLFLRQDAIELSYMRDALDLTDEQLAAISTLQTSKRQFATAFLMNGTRGSATISIRVADPEYWIATNEPISDEPLRRRALREANGDRWQALRLLADPDWHALQDEQDAA